MIEDEKLIKEQEDQLIKAGIQQLLAESAAQTTTDNKSLPYNPSDPKILKWKSDKQTHELTLLRSDGSVLQVSREEALGLKVEILQELLELTLCREEDDSDSMEFELSFKGQIRDLINRNKDPNN